MKYSYTEDVIINVELTQKDAVILVEALACLHEHGESYKHSGIQTLMNELVQAFSHGHGKVYMPELKIAVGK
tara:strand:+ start:595 stop:810 length:216 start_codon:yes stop_codon:yes gene_type:complete